MKESSFRDEACEEVVVPCGGLPIEIGWAFIDLCSTGEIQSESHLVKPPLHWDMKPVWHPDAEKLHGISLEQLLAHGVRRSGSPGG